MSRASFRSACPFLGQEEVKFAYKDTNIQIDVFSVSSKVSHTTVMGNPVLMIENKYNSQSATRQGCRVHQPWNWRMNSKGRRRWGWESFIKDSSLETGRVLEAGCVLSGVFHTAKSQCTYNLGSNYNQPIGLQNSCLADNPVRELIT